MYEKKGLEKKLHKKKLREVKLARQAPQLPSCYVRLERLPAMFKTSTVLPYDSQLTSHVIEKSAGESGERCGSLSDAKVESGKDRNHSRLCGLASRNARFMEVKNKLPGNAHNFTLL